jgi:hypothetical protein
MSARWDIVAWRGGWEIAVARGRIYVNHWPGITDARPIHARMPAQPAWKHHARAVVDRPWTDRLGLAWYARFELVSNRRIFAAPFWMLFLGALTITAAFHRLDRRRLKPGICPCGYDLKGNTSGRCPECGAAVLLPALAESGT